MRTLNDYFIDGGTRTAIETGLKASPAVTIPDDGTLVAVAIHISVAATTVTHTFDVIKGSGGTTADTGVDITIVGALAVNTGQVCYLNGTVNVKAGDRLYLSSNDETADTCSANFNWIIRR